MEKHTLKAKKIKRARKHGFMHKMKTAAGRNVLQRRRRKGRKKTAL